MVDRVITAPVAVAVAVNLTGQTVVYAASVSVVTYVVFCEAGQSDTHEGQAVILYSFVVYIVDAAICPSEATVGTVIAASDPTET